MAAWLSRITPTGVAVLVSATLLAGALVFHGATNRYEFANLGPKQLTKRDRLTGRLELCTITYALVCAAAIEPDGR